MVSFFDNFEKYFVVKKNILIFAQRHNYEAMDFFE